MPNRVMIADSSGHHQIPFTYDLFSSLGRKRSLTTDRTQEGVDMALDLFIAACMEENEQADELTLYDHARRESILLRVSYGSGDRILEVI